MYISISRLETLGDHKPEIAKTACEENDFFSHVTQSGLKRPLHVTRDLSNEREFRCTVVFLSQFHCGNEVKQGHEDTRYKQTNCRPDYIP